MHFTNKQLYNIIFTIHSLILAVHACTKFGHGSAQNWDKYERIQTENTINHNKTINAEILPIGNQSSSEKKKEKRSKTWLISGEV